ncbi:MAG: rhamnulokinase, partial [Opitutae bacterium]|nr:rhamnulokinase [Opitutae bacterium]
FESDRPVLGAAALAARIANERIGDGRSRPLTNVIGLWLLEQTLRDFTVRPGNDREWGRLITAAERLGRGAARRRPRASSSDAPAYLLDVTDPAFVNPPSMRAAIDGQLKKRKLPVPRTLAAYVRLICDSLGQGHADAIRAFERLAGRKFSRILIVGGGSKNRLLCQATADASGLPVVSLQIEGTAVGNLASQLVALRVVKNKAEFRRIYGAALPQTRYLPGSAPR